ncbi:3-phosphoshikimate 1-carboxyvinyltransferase [Solidesulfovibrio fructosivorans JJ]]|uniref:3-phosphoshikimate 1-carboxyvinyltransferase n=1 Tax=Solidesulfovibrio fructosivorans JJ] TaxID=596151 RepID=E1JYH5_SOLFR|nr:3-phosphoshikimate 1-carboxyvinyltransferase [Solidesulfovibrio fructosivorans]EFL50559.1 3-phosphoshikimate 1-carboxyvinyltransferase [Solidesulfovibrio fructosivorans JJ]]
MPTVAAPPSKSVSHRAVIAASLAAGTSRVSGLLDSQDITRTRDCMAAMGADFHPQSDGSVIVSGTAGHPQGGDVEHDEPQILDVGESGTTCRLLTAVAAAGRGVFEIRGEGRMHDRPIGELVNALLPLGVEILYLEKSGCPPLHMASNGLSGGTASISLEDSSQYLSGLLLAAPLAAAPLTVEITGNKTVSWPYVAITLSTLADFSVPFAVETRDGDAWERVDWRTLTDVIPGQVRFAMRPALYKPRDYAVEGDWSSASYFLAAGAVGKAPVTVTGLRPDSLQGDRAICDILARMGARIEAGPDGITVLPGSLTGQDLDMGRCPDLVPTVATAACFAKGETTIRNVAHLRLKESDRIEAVAENCTQAGAVVTTTPDGMRIKPRPLPTGERVEFSAFGDHRLAMSAAIFEMAGIEVALDNPACVAKSFPTFWEKWRTLRP